MNVIEALFVTLGLDAGDFHKQKEGVDDALVKLGQTSDKQTKIIAESGKKAANTFSLLKIEVLGALAAFGMSTGFKSFIESSMNAQASAGRTADALGVSVQSLRAYKLMAEEMGESGEAAVGTLQKVAQGLANAKHGDFGFLQAAASYGVRLSPDDGVEATMSKINRAAYDIKQKYGGAQAVNFLNGLGIGDLAQQTQLMESTAKYAADYAESMKQVGVWTQKEIERAGELQKQWAQFGQRMENVKVAVFDKLEPILIKIGDRFAKWLNSVDWNKVITAIGRVIDKVQEVVKDLGGWKTVAEVLGAVLTAKLLAPLLLMVGAFGKLIPLLGTSTTGAWGAMAGLGGAAGIALAALTGLAALHIDALGGKKRADGTYEDEMPLPKDYKGPTNDELWARVQGKESTYRGTAMQAALMLASRSYADTMSEDTYQQMAQQILSGKMSPKDIDIGARPTSDNSPQGSKAIQYFMSQGFSRNEAIGMAANIAAESAFDPYQYGDHGKAYGIGQWHADRQANFARVMGLPIQASSYEQQLEFYAYEVKHNKPLMKAFGQDPNAGASAMLVSVLDERPKDAAGEAERRALIAQHMANGYVGARPSGLAVKGAGGTTTHTVTINGGVNVNAPKATDAKGIVKGMKTALQNNPLTSNYVMGTA